jgi:tetratricopeptide (TPR) repeat protein
MAVVTLVFLVVAGIGCEKLRARDQLNKGAQAFKNARYPDAVEHFKRAIQLDPAFPTARLYLATAYMVQYIPGAESPENLRMAEAAHDHFLKVLEQDPNNTVAMSSIAKLFFDQNKLDESREWYLKLVDVDSQNKEAHYTVGVIAWTRSFQPRMEVRAKLGMNPEDPRPIKDKRAREQLREKILPIIEEGMEHLNAALEIDNEYDDAMVYLNLLYRDRADLAETAAEYRKDGDIADDWVQKAMETRQLKADRTPQPGGFTTEE